jgi:FkbM family methyltransferase
MEMTRLRRIFRPRAIARRVRRVYRLRRVTPDWLKLVRSSPGGDGASQPPVRLRSGFVMNHGKWDNPVLMLEEVFLDRWYEHDGGSPPSDATMVDIGANMGAVSLYWAGAADSLQIHAYEPNPAANNTLQTNVSANDLHRRVEVFAEAVGRGDGELDLWVDVPTDLSTGYLDHSPVDGGRRVSVPMVGMEQIWQRLDRRGIWLLKVDTEGAEADILEGAPLEMLQATQNAIIEYHDNICPGASERCRKVLDAAGFRYRTRVHPWDEGIFYASRD